MIYKRSAPADYKFIFILILISNCNLFAASLQRSPRSSITSNNYFSNYVVYSEISNRLEIFTSEQTKLSDFNEIAIDYSNEHIYIGARNAILKLFLQNDTIVTDTESNIIYWEPSQDTDIECRRSISYAQQTKMCHNYVRVLLIDQPKKKLLTCGTNANKPVCIWRNLNQLDHVVERLDGLGKCPQSPDSSLSYLSLLNGDIYFATSIDYSAQGMKPDYLINRGLGPSKQIRTDQYNSNWLNEPEFVASIEVDDYVYFFMRETAIEYMNCGQKVYSRVARLCKHDQGTENFDVWKTFEKARLNCSVPANNLTDHFGSSNIYQSAEKIHQYAYSFDEIQNVYFDKRKNLIYAIFSTPINGIKGSAICVYDTASLKRVFDGPFKYQKSKDSIWEPYTEPIEKTKCEPSTSSSKSKPTDGNKFQLKHMSVQPIFERPIIVISNHRLTKLVVDNVLTKNQENIKMLFIATEHNTILKYMLLNMDLSSKIGQQHQYQFPSVCLLEEIEILDQNNKKYLNSINNLMLWSKDFSLEEESSGSSKNRNLLISTSFNFIKMPVANCESQQNYFSCLSLMDPYCIWDSKAQKCLLIFKTNETLFYSQSKENVFNGRSIAQNIKLNTHLHQHSIISCPNTNNPVDGGFSEWSAWTNCISKSGDKCKCRMRLCNEPTPRNGGKNCDENKAIEILNCEVHGGWTHWSAWSACKGGQATNCEQIASSLTSKTQLESAIRTRTRTCTNPEPKFNGRLCVGLDQEEEVCTPEMINPCSLFLGNSLSISNSNNGNMNSITNNQWTSWGPWEECSKTCGEGFQMRRRSCNGKLCIGCNQEWRTCNSEPCKERVETIITVWDQIEANKESNQKLEKRFKFLCKYDHYLEANNMDGMELNSSTEYRLCEDEKFCRSIKSLKELGVFSAWGEWSACKSCSDIQFRTRKCNVVNTCFGHERETRDCDCSNLNKEDHGWSCWSDFGACSSNCGKGVHRRTRKCLANNYECIGPREEITTCFNANCSGFERNNANEKLFASISSLTNKDQIGIIGVVHHDDSGFIFSITHIIITNVISFLLGSLLVLSIHLYYKPDSRKQSLLCCCCSKKSSKLSKKSSSCRDTQLSSSLDRNSDATDTAITDLHSSDCSKMQYCLAGSSDSSCTSANSNHSKEYFTVGNRFDPNGLSSLLNDCIPDDDDDDLRNGLNMNNFTPNSHSNSGIHCGTLGRGTNSKTLSKVINQNCLPNKSFNTYTNHKDLNIITNNKNSKSTTNNNNIQASFGSNNGTSSGASSSNSTSNAGVTPNNLNNNNTAGNNRNNTNTLNITSSRYSNFASGTMNNGSVRSNNKQPRNSFAFSNLRTNLDQEL